MLRRLQLHLSGICRLIHRYKLVLLVMFVLLLMYLSPVPDVHDRKGRIIGLGTIIISHHRTLDS